MKDGHMVPNCVPKEEINEDSDTAARELHTYADNNAHLYKTSHVPVVKNLEKKYKKGTYDHEKAKTLWKYHADRAADSYAKEHGSGQKGHEMFSGADRKKAAERMANKHHDEMKAGNFHKEEACWSGYTAVGMKMKNGRMVPNCVPTEAVTQEKPPFEGPYKKSNNPVSRSRLKMLTKKARETIAKSKSKTKRT